MARKLDDSTLDAVQATSIALDLQMLRGRSPFDPAVTAIFRIATLSDQLTTIVKEATADFGGFGKTDSVVLSKNLITLAAHALAWAELLDKEEATNPQHCPHGYGIGIACGICGTGVSQ